jgi:hypothetical protein
MDKASGYRGISKMPAHQDFGFQWGGLNLSCPIFSSAMLNRRPNPRECFFLETPRLPNCANLVLEAESAKTFLSADWGMCWLSPSLIVDSKIS